MSEDKRMKEKNIMLRRVREAKERFGNELLRHPDIHGLGIGYKKKGGEKTKELALVVHVYKKRKKKELKKSRIIPSKLTFLSRYENVEITVPIDVREALPPVPEIECGVCDEDLEARVRPVPGGYSVGLSNEGAGTLGGWVWDLENEEFVFISNEHVLGSIPGDHVLQPGFTDGGRDPADYFANVVRAGTLDVAIAAPNDTDDMLAEIICSGPAVYEIADAELEMEIEKVGQTTRLTCGIVDLIDYDTGHYGSHNDIYIDGDGTDFSQGGDSGSLYVEKEHPEGYNWKRVVGIHWGGPPGGFEGVGHPIREVFNDLNISIVCGGVISSLIDSIFSSEKEEREIMYKHPIFKRRGKPALYRGFAREFEKRIMNYPTGKMINEHLHRHRVEAVKFLLNRDGMRATVSALRPILQKSVTTDDVLEYRVSENDLENFSRVLKVAERILPNLREEFMLLKKLMNLSRGKSIDEILKIRL
jgi:hypothetical protein